MRGSQHSLLLASARYLGVRGENLLPDRCVRTQRSVSNHATGDVSRPASHELLRVRFRLPAIGWRMYVKRLLEQFVPSKAQVRHMLRDRSRLHDGIDGGLRRRGLLTRSVPFAARSMCHRHRRELRVFVESRLQRWQRVFNRHLRSESALHIGLFSKLRRLGMLCERRHCRHFVQHRGRVPPDSRLQRPERCCHTISHISSILHMRDGSAARSRLLHVVQRLRSAAAQYKFSVCAVGVLFCQKYVPPQRRIYRRQCDAAMLLRLGGL